MITITGCQSSLNADISMFSLVCVTCTQLLFRFTHDELFLPPDRVMRCIERHGCVPTAAKAEKNTKMPIQCNRCSLRVRSMSALKTHLRVCSAPFKVLPAAPDPPVSAVVAADSTKQPREDSGAAKSGGFQVSRWQHSVYCRDAW